MKVCRTKTDSVVLFDDMCTGPTKPFNTLDWSAACVLAMSSCAVSSWGLCRSKPKPVILPP